MKSMKYQIILTIVLALVLVCCFGALADILPETPYTPSQPMPSHSNIEVIGTIIEKTERDVSSTNRFFNGGGFLTEGEIDTHWNYKQETISNGGYLSQSKVQTFNDGNVNKRGYNVDTATVQTYASDGAGSTLRSSESLSLEVSGNFSSAVDIVASPLINEIMGDYFPAFTSSYGASSDLYGVTTMASTTRGSIRGAATNSSDAPAELNYDVIVQPDASTGLGYAEAGISVDTAASWLEGPAAIGDNDPDTYYDPAHSDWNTNYWDDEARTTTYREATNAAGKVFSFSKSYSVKSGIDI